MPRLFISADLEGVCGVVSPRQCDWKSADRAAYDGAVRQLAREVNAVIEGALEGGATAVLVNDSHYTMTNLTLDHVGRTGPVYLLSGKPKLCAMSAGLDHSFDGVIFIGYHAKAGTAGGILCHTFHDQLFDVRVNGVSYGEGGINAFYANLVHGVPVILASGDRAFCQEITGLMPHLDTVMTKESISFSCAKNRPEEEVLRELREKAKTLVHQKAQHTSAWDNNRLELTPPYTLEVTLTTTLGTDIAMTMPGLERMDGRTVRYVTQDFSTLYQALQTIYSLLAYGATL